MCKRVAATFAVHAMSSWLLTGTSLEDQCLEHHIVHTKGRRTWKVTAPLERFKTARMAGGLNISACTYRRAQRAFSRALQTAGQVQGMDLLQQHKPMK